MREIQGELPNNPWIDRDIEKHEAEALIAMTQSEGWKMFTFLKAYQQGISIQEAMNTELPQGKRDAATGVFKATASDLQFADDAKAVLEAIASKS